MFWLCTALLSGGQRLGNSQAGLCPNTSTASESFRQPFSRTFFQDPLAGHCLSMHSCSYGTTFGEMRLLCRAMMPRTTMQPPQPGSQRLGDQQIRLVTPISPVPCSLRSLCWGRMCHPWRLFLDKSLAGQSQCGLQPTVSWRSDGRSPEVSANWHFCAPIVCSALAPAKQIQL